MNWGTSIAIGYISFVGFMIFMVIKTMGVQVDLVTPDYYEEEIHTNEQNQKLRNTQDSKKKLLFKTTDSALIFDFSKWEDAEKISGEVKLFCPSDAKLDLTFNFILTDNKQYIIKSDKLSNKFYKVMVDWQIGSDSYFEEFSFLKK